MVLVLLLSIFEVVILLSLLIILAVSTDCEDPS